MKSLVDTIVAGFPIEHKDLPHAAPFWRYRESLYVTHGVVMFDDRVVISPALRRQVLDSLHAAHQGQSSMELRARAIVFWPGMTRDIANVRARCDDCDRNALSQASLPSTPAKLPSVPFEAVVADYLLSRSLLSRYCRQALGMGRDLCYAIWHEAIWCSRPGGPSEKLHGYLRRPRGTV